MKVGEPDVGKVVYAGHSDELNARRAVFDVADYVRAYGTAGTVRLKVQRCGDAEAYLVTPERSGDLATWTFSLGDTQKPGYGTVQVLFYDGDVLLKKSDKLFLFVSRALDGDASPPDPREPYPGPYEVTSLVGADQTLETANKIVSDNITVKEIPYAETTNLSGGYTVTIGG